MFYRLPFLFSITYYFFLLFAQMVELLFGQTSSFNFGLDYRYNETNIFYFLFEKMTHNTTMFFFVLILSCILFYQNKLYYYTAQNKRKVMLFGVILAIIYFWVKYSLLKFAHYVILPKLMSITYTYQGYHEFDSYQFMHQFLQMFAFLWSCVIIGAIFYFMVKLSKFYFQAPLIDGITSSYQNLLINDENQLNSDMILKEYRKLYAIIFSATFCGIIHGFIWNTYFSINDSFEEIVQEHYILIYLSAIFMIAFHYCFLFIVANKTIIKTYSWLPISSILAATTVTLILFGIVMLFASIVILSLAFVFNFLILFALWFVVNYFVLYFLSRFTLRRYFV